VNKVKCLSDVGLAIKLGQSSDTLSGGEAQRVKLASFLGRGRLKINYSSSLMNLLRDCIFHDIRKLLASFNALIEEGHSGDCD
jgi:excinuclease ABC subunit A